MSDTPAKRAREAKKRRKLEEKKDRKLQRKLNPVVDDEVAEQPEGVQSEQIDGEEPVSPPEG